MPTSIQIEQYHVLYSSNQFDRRIGLLANNTYVGQLVFHPNGKSLPVDGMNGSQIQLHYHREDFANVMDLLRNEKPVFLRYNGSGGGFENGLDTSQEPVGAGEPLGRFVGRMP